MKWWPKLLFILSVIIIFRAWFTLQPLSGGDWAFLFDETIVEFSFIPAARADSYFPLRFFYQTTAKILNSLSFSWPLIERLVWFWPFLILTIFSSWFLGKTLFPQSKIIRFWAPLIYLFNTYSLMIVGGGQMGVAMGYALAPLVLGSLIRYRALAGLILAVQIMFDPRIALLTLVAGVLLVGFKKTLRISLVGLWPHLFWLLPLFWARQDFWPTTHGELGWLSFLSVAEFPKSISLLHPNWPENLFGKTYLMRPEFLILPILAYSSLWFGQKNKTILLLALLGLLGAFLAKGVNPPAGFIYLWLFESLPVLKLFRDPTKFYTLVALAYSILIPYTLEMAALKVKILKK